MKIENIKFIKQIVVFGSMIIYFLLWCKLPRTVGIHSGLACEADAYGSKMILLPAVLLPLLSFIPWSYEEPTELHSAEMQDLYKEMVEDEKKKVQYIQLGLAIIEMFVLMGIIIMARASVK